MAPLHHLRAVWITWSSLMLCICHAIAAVVKHVMEGPDSKRPRLYIHLKSTGGEQDDDEDDDCKMPAKPAPSQRYDTQREVIEISSDEEGEWDREEVEVLPTRAPAAGSASSSSPLVTSSSSPAVPEKGVLPLLPYYLIEVRAQGGG